jgi:hypothetical protein
MDSMLNMGQITRGDYMMDAHTFDHQAIVHHEEKVVPRRGS